MPVHPVLARDQPVQLDEGLPQQRVLPEGAVAQNPQVDHALVQVSPGDPLIHQLRTTVDTWGSELSEDTRASQGNATHHLVVGGVTGAARRLRLPLTHLLGVWKQVELHVGVWVCAVLQGLLLTQTQRSRLADPENEWWSNYDNG